MRRNRKKIGYLLTVFFIAATTACSGKSLVEDGLNPDISQLHGVEVSTLHRNVEGAGTKALQDGEFPWTWAPPAGDDEPQDYKVFTNDQGYQISLAQASLRWEKLTIVSEGDAWECRPGFDQEIPLGHFDDLMAVDNVAAWLGEKSIPRGNYCRYELQLGRENSELAKRHAGHGDFPGPEGDEQDAAFYLVGYWGKENVGAGLFKLVARTPITVRGNFQTLENGVVLEHPLHFEDEESVELVFATDYAALFSGVDFVNAGPEAWKRVEANVPKAVRQHVGEHGH